MWDCFINGMNVDSLISIFLIDTLNWYILRCPLWIILTIFCFKYRKTGTWIYKDFKFVCNVFYIIKVFRIYGKWWAYMNITGMFRFGSKLSKFDWFEIWVCKMLSGGLLFRGTCWKVWVSWTWMSLVCWLQNSFRCWYEFSGNWPSTVLVILIKLFILIISGIIIGIVFIRIFAVVVALIYQYNNRFVLD